MIPEICRCCAKKRGDMWLPIHIHSFDTAEVAQQIYYSMCNESKFPKDFIKVVRLVAYLHDVGKITKSFQDKILRGINNKTSHAAAGEAILLKFGFDRRIASIVGAHHGKPQKLGFEPEDYYITALSEDPENLTYEQTRFIEEGLDYVGYKSLSDVPKISVKQMHLLWGIVSMADWLASNETYFPLFPPNQYGLDAISYCQRFNMALLDIDIPEGWHPKLRQMSQGEFAKRFGFRPNNSQRMCYTIANNVKNPGIMIVEEKMGGGKTEGALACAEVLATRFGCTGLAFLLPTKATTDCMFSRITNWARKQSDNEYQSISLSHSSAYLNHDFSMLTEAYNEQTCLLPHEFFKRGKTDLLANFTIATIDKGIVSAYKTKHYGMKMLGLHNKVVIIDECHAYDAYMNTYLDELLEWLGYFKTPVIILSATLPAGRRREIIEAYNTGRKLENNVKRNYEDTKKKVLSPRITWTDSGSLNVRTLHQNAKKKDVVIDVKRINRQSIENVVKTELSGGGCAGIIVNSVAEAQSLGSAFTRHFKDFQVFVIHSMFTDGDRKRIENAIYERVGKESGRKKRNKVIIIGTQVLEQSLDIDFDVLITEMCPADLLFQRIGRLHRHDRYRPESLRTPRLYILECNCPIYEPFLINRTNKRIGKTLYIPSQIPRIVNGVYALTKKERQALRQYLESGDSGSKRFTNEHCEEYLAYQRSIDDKKQRASVFKIKSPHEYDKFDSLDGVLDNMPTGEAKDKVRDGVNNISVYLVKDNGRKLLPWAKPKYAHRTYEDGYTPTGQYVDAVLQQRISLPKYFSSHKTEIIHWLDMGILPMYKKVFRNNAILRRGHFLALDEGNRAYLSEKHLHYDKKLGLCMS